MKGKIIICYVPVLHAGYLSFFRRHEDAEAILILSENILISLPSELKYLQRKDALRAVPAQEMALVLRQLVKPPVGLFRGREGRRFGAEVTIVAPDEDITRAVAAEYFPDLSTLFENVFLRWHRNNVTEETEVQPGREVNVSQFEEEMLYAAERVGAKSADWWRQVGALLVRDGIPILTAVNQHMPDPQMPNAFGDPRSLFSKGVNFHLSTADHAEAILIGESARRGISLRGTWLFVTDFPCPSCARLVARSGVTRCYYGKGYAVLDGEDILRSSNVELVHVSPRAN